MRTATDDIRVILFDMDGTLYQDHEFHRNYLRYLLTGTNYENFREQAVRLADEIMDHGAVPMNRFYRIRPINHSVASWQELVSLINADLVDEMPFEACYRDGLCGLQFLADPWEVATMIAAKLGVLDQNGEPAFLQIRQEMEDKALMPNQELREMLEKLKERYTTVLLSNSPQTSAANFIDRLGFTGAFTFNLYDACKPYRLFENLHCHPGLEHVPSSAVLSVGDHAFNEIVNVHLAGGKTIWMNPYADAPQIPCTFQIKNIPQLMQLLQDRFL